MDKIEVKFKSIIEGAQIPEYDTKHSSGCDLALSLNHEIILYPCEVQSLPNGIAVEIPAGFEGQIRSRSGMARKGIVVANAPGTVESGYTEEIKILLLNTTDKPIKILPGQKVAQIVFVPIVRAEFIPI
ncbi:MAG: dUTP diphosphatase [Syntrophomonadaceae bacterium]|jgi:dUTP pyrophosphatase|nr:dUTP diphosphatase [Syntrophomonadaceae bacterium]